MKFKTLALTAVTCVASIFGTSMTAAFASPIYDLNSPAQIETQELSKSVRNRNTIIGAVAGAVAIAAIANHNNKKNYDEDKYNDRDRYNERDRYDDRNNRNDRNTRSEDYQNRNSGNRNAPPPPPMPSRR